MELGLGLELHMELHMELWLGLELHTELWLGLELGLHTELSRGTRKRRQSLVLGVCRASSVRLNGLKMTATAKKKKRKKKRLLLFLTIHNIPPHTSHLIDIYEYIYEYIYENIYKYRFYVNSPHHQDDTPSS
jgi:hypothetical protein